MAVFKPLLAFALTQRLKNRFCADPMSSVRVSEVACNINLIRLNLVEKFENDVYILLSPLSLLDTSCLIERKVEEVRVCVGVKTERTHCCACLGTTDCRFEIQKFARFRFAGTFRRDDCLHLVEVVAVAEFMDCVHMLEDHVVMHGNVARSLVGHMDVVTLLNEADECSSHGYDVIVRVRGENEHILRERCGRNRPCAVVSVRFSARPSRNRVLEVVEHVYVNLVERALELKKLSE